MVKRKFWNAEVSISQNVYEDTYTVMYILRLLGLLPLTVQRKALGLFLKLNPWYTLYSCLLGTATLSAIYYRIYEELAVDKKPTHTAGNTDKFVRFTAVNGFCVIVFYDVFVMPTQLLGYYKFIKYTGQVDNLINTTFSKLNRYRSVFLLTMPLICNITTTVFDIYANFRVNKEPLFGTLKRNISYYSTYLIAFAGILLSRYLANCLEVRAAKMNSILEEEYKNIKKHETADNHISAISRASQNTGDDVSVIDQSAIASLSHFRASVAVTKVAQAYLKLIKAAEKVRNLLGIILTMATVAVLCQLVASKYFIIMALEGKSHDVFELLDWTAVFSVQIMKVLFIIEPWYSCVGELDTLKCWVSNLSSLNLDKGCREKVASFSMILCLRQYEFTACGLFVIDRLLYTTLIDNVITFLVISLQAEEEDTV